MGRHKKEKRIINVDKHNCGENWENCVLGIDRTEALVALEIILRMFWADQKGDVKESGNKIRTQSHGSVQTDVQYVYICCCVLKWCRNVKVTNQLFQTYFLCRSLRKLSSHMNWWIFYSYRQLWLKGEKSSCCIRITWWQLTLTWILSISRLRERFLAVLLRSY